MNIKAFKSIEKILSPAVIHKRYIDFAVSLYKI